MFDFYSLFYKEGYLKLEDLKEAAKWNVISKEEFKTITGEELITQ
ncbi:hypothetical protein BD780_000228 [Clostridium tetanomorphum]|uniref:XkdX family protein n=1 Tax=Clostridium tetanomorphum TaxID=1553 RepID=A0A923E7Q6_CLOTT|nr:XkdX family protein [Clostridium tetanomorphum]KAJ51106.1 hypothetical protein CTM_14508 [Clostridium tetanomorphum DSM 665]MBC2398025.1 XkdX family protein [Clostridium tetanomorphum]MBP1864466.1 hypothetical protein [Clostridium tetanomorphum]NRS83003.1 hypothetical protein [Clostridium tetanomorphum]NRZ98901.1 hypothetical protein [Clostridium tetanomorphum]